MNEEFRLSFSSLTAAVATVTGMDEPSVSPWPPSLARQETRGLPPSVRKRRNFTRRIIILPCRLINDADLFRPTE